MTVLVADPATRSITPDRSYTQRRNALNHANEIRRYRARVKKDLQAGRVGLLELLAGPVYTDPLLRTMKVRELLLATPKLGTVKVDNFLRKAAVSPSKTIAGLTYRQRDAIWDLVLSWSANQKPRRHT